MPNNPRQNILRQLDQVLNHITTIQNYLVVLGETYREFHPDYTKNYEVAFAFTDQLKAVIEGLKEVA